MGIRPGLSDHIQDNKKTLQFTLDEADRAAIEAVVKKGHELGTFLENKLLISLSILTIFLYLSG